MNAADDTALVEFMSALQVVLLSGVGEDPLADLERFAELAQRIPSTCSQPHSAILQSVLIIHVGHWSCTVVPDTAAAVLRALSAVRDARGGDLRDKYLAALAIVRTMLVGPHRGRYRTSDPRVEAALQYVRSHYTDHPLRLDDVARTVHVSRWHLERLMKQHTGLRFTAHVRQARLTAACRLLESPGLSLKEVAARIGYPHVSEFTRDFKAAFHMAPRDWRRRI